MRRGVIAAGLFLLVIAVGAFFMLRTAEDEPAPFYDELRSDPVAQSPDAPESEPEAAQSAKPADSRPKADVVIRDNYFVGLITDMTTNMHDYEGKTVQYEGFIHKIPPDLEAQESFAVCRMFYCCGEDAYFVGFPCDGVGEELPEDDTWVVVTGVMGIRSDPDGEYPFLQVTAMNLLPEPGKAYVYQ